MSGLLTQEGEALISEVERLKEGLDTAVLLNEENKARAESAEAEAERLRDDMRINTETTNRAIARATELRGELHEVEAERDENYEWGNKEHERAKQADTYRKALEKAAEHECERFTGKDGCRTFKDCANDDRSKWCFPCKARQVLEEANDHD